MSVKGRGNYKIETIYSWKWNRMQCQLIINNYKFTKLGNSKGFQIF